MSSLILDGRAVTLDWVADRWDAFADESAEGERRQLRDALAFCRRWLRGDAEFTLHTSGSTGAPKSITVQRDQIEASARLTGAALGLQAGMRALVCLNAGYVAGVMMLARGLVLGLELTVVAPSRRPLAPFAEGEPFAFTALAPLQLRETLRQAPDRALLDQMHAVLIGGAPIEADLLAELAAVRAPLYHTYGMTETVSHVALRRLNGPTADDRFIPLPDVVIGRDARGCLTVRGPMTRHQTVVANDRIELFPDGSFRWLGRVDNVINTGGVKVQAEVVEAALARIWPGRRLFVVGTPDPVLGEAVTAVVEGEPPVEPPTAVVQRAALFGRYAAPRRYLFVPRFAETPTGKIDRRATLALLDAAALPAHSG